MDAGHEAVAGVGEQDIEAGEFFAATGDKGVDVGRAGDVAAEDFDGGAEGAALGGDLFEALERRHPGPGPRRPGPSARAVARADSRGRTGDDDGLGHKVSVGCGVRRHADGRGRGDKNEKPREGIPGLGIDSDDLSRAGCP